MNAILRTNRLTLRPMEDGDDELLWPGIADPEVSRLMAWDAHTSKDQTTSFVKHEVERWRTRRGITWVILWQGEFCGIFSFIGVMRTHRALRYDRAELAYWLLPAYRGRGFMTEAAEEALRFGFNEFKLHKVVVSHFAVNQESKKLILRLGFRFVGTQLQEFQKNAVWHDHVLYEMLDYEFAARQPKT